MSRIQYPPVQDALTNNLVVQQAGKTNFSITQENEEKIEIEIETGSGIEESEEEIEAGSRAAGFENGIGSSMPSTQGNG